MSFKEKIINKILKEEKERFLPKLIQAPADSLEFILTQYGIPFAKSGNTFKIPVNSEEEILITVEKQKAQK